MMLKASRTAEPVSDAAIQSSRSDVFGIQVVCELRALREEVAALRVALEEHAPPNRVGTRLSELEIEQRLWEIEQELVEESKPQKRRWFRR